MNALRQGKVGRGDPKLEVAVTEGLLVTDGALEVAATAAAACRGSAR